MTNPASGAQPGVDRLARVTLFGALIGLPAGLIAFGFIWLVHELEHWLWHDVPTMLGQQTPPWYLVLGLPLVGGLLVHFARQLPGDGGHSPNHVGFSGGGRPGDALSVAAAALATLAFGMVLGPEAPLLALGSAAALWLTSRAKLELPERRLVGTAGSSAAMSALFGGPLVAGMLMLESGAGAGLPIVPIMLPALAAASVSYLLVTGLGTWSGLPVNGLTIPNLPAYTSVNVVDLLAAIVVGVLMAVVTLGIRRLANAVAGLEDRIGRLPLLLGGGLGVGGVALLAESFGANPLDVLFSGQTSIAPLFQATGATLLALFVAKAVAYALSLGAGFRGGAIFPAIFIAIAIADAGVLGFGLSPTAAVAIGAAAGMAAMTRLVVSPVLFAGLLVGSGGLEAIPVAAVAALAAWLVSTWLDQRGATKAAAPLSP